jgi:hypothetical protein
MKPPHKISLGRVGFETNMRKIFDEGITSLRLLTEVH